MSACLHEEVGGGTWYPGESPVADNHAAFGPAHEYQYAVRVDDYSP